ncbi:MAG: HAD family hydrolase [Syntrophomonadaceae bacterium]
MKTIIFDFGGTLDTDGIHWCVKFLETCQDVGILIPEKIFRNAYVLAERDMTGKLGENTGFLETLHQQILFQLKHLVEDYNCRFYDHLPRIAEELSLKCYNDVKNNISIITGMLQRLSKNYELGVISNFYGNLAHVLKELGLFEFFSLIMDSEVNGLRKPDTRFYLQLLEETTFAPDEIIMVGDSYENDIVPSKNLGFKTIWLRGKSWKYPDDYSKADFVIGSLTETEDAVRVMEKMNFCKSFFSHMK